jgi:dipeptidyl-peptidase-4
LLLAAGWPWPEPFQVKGRDGKTDIYGAIYRPSNFNPSHKYPVIDGIYNGPQAVRTPKSFQASSHDQAIAELGFIVVTVDGMGTAMRSKAFHNVSYKNLGDSGLEDHILAIKQLAEKYPYLDLDRVGIYGHSAGGYDSAHALLTHPEFYKVAVSSSGCHDNRSDKVWWNELWMGYPVGEHYKQQANPTLAANLKGKLLLVHGDLDDNVHPAATLQFVDALIKANKDFDLLIMPNKHHGLGNGYFVRKRWDYFVKNLLGVEPPKEYPLLEPEERDR